MITADPRQDSWRRAECVQRIIFCVFRGIRNSAAARLAKLQGVDPNDELVDRDQRGRAIRYDGRRCFQFFGPFF